MKGMSKKLIQNLSPLSNGVYHWQNLEPEADSVDFKQDELVKAQRLLVDTLYLHFSYLSSGLPFSSVGLPNNTARNDQCSMEENN